MIYMITDYYKYNKLYYYFIYLGVTNEIFNDNNITDVEYNISLC